MVKNVAMHNGKTVLHNVINLYVYICICIYISVHIYTHIYIYTHMYVLQIVSRVESQLATFIRGGSYIEAHYSGHRPLQYLLEEFCRNARQLSIKLDLLSNQTDDVFIN